MGEMMYGKDNLLHLASEKEIFFFYYYYYLPNVVGGKLSEISLKLFHFLPMDAVQRVIGKRVRGSGLDSAIADSPLTHYLSSDCQA